MIEPNLATKLARQLARLIVYPNDVGFGRNVVISTATLFWLQKEVNLVTLFVSTS